MNCPQPAPDNDRPQLRNGMRVWGDDFTGRAPGLRDLPHGVALGLLALPHEAAMSRIFEDMAARTDADRAWMFEYSPDLGVFRNSHEWCRDGVSSHLGDLQNTPVTIMGELHHHLVCGHPVLIPDVAALGRSMRSLRVELRRQSIRSTITVPVHHDGRLRAAVGIDATRAPRQWGDEITVALLQVARLIGAARFSGRRAERDEGLPWPEPQVYLRTTRSIRGVALDAITLVRADGDSSLVSLADGSTFPDLRPLKWWSQVLPADRFVRLHRSTLARAGSITSLLRRPGGGWRALIAGVEAPTNVSRGALAALRNRLGY